MTVQDLDEVRLGLTAFNRKFIYVDEILSIGVFIRNEQGKKLAGRTGLTGGNWLLIDMLCVSEALCVQGTGSTLIQARQVAGAGSR